MAIIPKKNFYVTATTGASITTNAYGGIDSNTIYKSVIGCDTREQATRVVKFFKGLPYWNIRIRKTRPYFKIHEKNPHMSLIKKEMITFYDDWTKLRMD